MERAGRDLDRVMTYCGIWSSNLSSPEFREIQMEMAPKLSEFHSKIMQNAALFARIRAVYESDEASALRPDQQRLVQLVYDRFARNGATLTGTAKERYAEINQRLAELHTQFCEQRAGRRGGLRHLPDQGPAGRPARVVRAGRGCRGRGARARGRVRDHEHALVDGSRS